MVKIRLGWLFLGFAILAVPGGGPSFHAAPSPARREPQDVDEAIRKGMRQVLSSQRPDGTWGDAARTALCIHALMNGPQTPDTLAAARKGIAGLPALIEELSKPLPPETLMDMRLWGISYALSHLHAAYKAWPSSEPKPDLASAVEKLAGLAASTRRKCGGWRYDIKGEFPGDTDGSQVFVTAVMADGLLKWSTEKGIKIDAALLERAISDVQRSCDGYGWCAYNHHGDYKGVGHEKWAHPGSAGRSIQAHVLLNEAGKGKPEMMKRFLEIFFKNREEYVKLRTAGDHTPPYQIHGGYYYHAHYYAGRALRKLGADPENYSKTLVDVLLKEQESGGWSDLGGELYGTAMALLVLSDVSLPWLGTIDQAVKTAAEEKRPLVVFFSDPGRTSILLGHMLRFELPRDLAGRFMWVRADFSKDNDLCRKIKLERGPALAIVMPGEPEPRRLAGWKNAAQLARVLEDCLSPRKK